MKKILSLIMIYIMVFSSSVNVYAASPSPKEEVVYGLLNYDGSVQNLYVVNIFDGGSITDFGNYEKVKNLTGNEPITVYGDMITVNTTADKFYYQGYLASKELPWNIEIKYYINDSELSGNELAGKSGRLKIQITVTQNPDMDSIFFENLSLQIALVLDSSLCSGIKADNATVAEAGGKKQINFTVLPGDSFAGMVTADVKDFEMESILFTAVRLNFDLDIDNSEYFNQFTELKKGIEELDDGAGKLLDGIKEVRDGIDNYTYSIKDFKESISQVSAGAEEIYKGAGSLSSALSELTKQNDIINSGANTLMQAAFDAINVQLSGMGLNLPVLTSENYESVLSAIPELQMIKLQLDGVMQFVEGLKDYTDAVEQIAKGAAGLYEGAKKFKENSAEITDASGVIYDGAVKISSGIGSLYDGMRSLKEGTGGFRSKTADLDSKINEGINNFLSDMFGNDKQIKSFVSEKNTGIISLQFVLRTEPIEIRSVPVTETSEPIKLTFWQKLLKLFGLYKE